jgi:DNA replication protein DnaC
MKRCGSLGGYEDWGKILGDHAATSAILGRFLDNVHMIKITGRSYRLKNVNKHNKNNKV